MSFRHRREFWNSAKTLGNKQAIYAYHQNFNTFWFMKDHASTVYYLLKDYNQNVYLQLNYILREIFLNIKKKQESNSTLNALI